MENFMKNHGNKVGNLGGTASFPNLFPINPKDLGNMTISPKGSFEAGSFQTFTLVYTAGKFGIDDSGSLRVCFRFASDQSKPQFSNPKGVNYTKITASNGAVLNYRYDPKGNVRPWDKTLYIKVVEGFLREGDTITIIFGDTSGGSLGMRLQTFCEETYEFHTLVDPIATFCYQPLPDQPIVKVVSGTPVRYVAVVQSTCEVGEGFNIKLKGEDVWGNPSNQCTNKFYLKASVNIKGLPESITLKPGNFYELIENLSVEEEAEFTIDFCDNLGEILFSSNPISVQTNLKFRYFWGDVHGQSEETIGTGTAEQYFSFARDYAFVDVTGHQGNDFQITESFWNKLDKLCEEFNEDGVFIVLPGYEWSGNTSLGGDRNVFFPHAGRKIRRSSHAMVADHTDIGSDCNTAIDLFKAFEDDNEFDVVCYAHCGGRYADIAFAHDGRFEKSVEVHSSWGTFEWLLEDAFELGYRVGIVGNSDGHKGRPGASYPGAGLFGAIGGLTCFLTDKLTRENILDCMRKRRHYATTGGPNGRPLVSVKFDLPKGSRLFHNDPRISDDKGYHTNEAFMGDIVHSPSGVPTLEVSIKASESIERVDIFNGNALMETIRPYTDSELGDRIRVVWSGAEYRGRFRQVVWDGNALVSGNKIKMLTPINFLNNDKKLNLCSNTEIEWNSLTTGNIGGFDIQLEEPLTGKLKIETPVINAEVSLKDVGIEDTIFKNNGVLPKFIKIFRLPNKGVYNEIKFRTDISIKEGVDNPIFIRFVQDDGTTCWTSPAYFYR